MPLAMSQTTSGPSSAVACTSYDKRYPAGAPADCKQPPRSRPKKEVLTQTGGVYRNYTNMRRPKSVKRISMLLLQAENKIFLS